MAFKIKTIESGEDKEKREKRNKLILGIILVIIMLLSTAGYAFFSTEKTEEQVNKVRYNNLDFYRQGDFWQTEISEYKFYFHYLPNETRNTEIKKTYKDYAGKPLYLTRNEVAEQEIQMNLGNIVERTNLACLPDTNCTGEWPEKNCSNNVIVIQERNFTTMAEEDNCVFIFSNDTLRDADAFLFRVLGIK